MPVLLPTTPASYLAGEVDKYKAESYRLQRVVKDAKKRYRDRVEAQMEQSDTRHQWQGLRTIRDYLDRTPSTVSTDASLADDLNSFFVRFEANNNTASRTIAEVSSIARDKHTLSVTEHNVRRALTRVNTTIFYLSLAEPVVPACFKWSTIVPVPKTASPACLNDYQTVTLTSLVMKYFDRLIRDYICAILPPSMDQLQFAYRPNSSTDDAVSQVIHSSLSHLDSQKGGYVRMLFIDLRSAFNTVFPSRLADKLIELGLNTPLCAWILNFLTTRP